jgi:1-hydroxy-2-isopentenylcarotenoid 3,4-desaturase
MNKEVIIIGAGFGGLSSAALLAKAGYKVTVLEKNDSVGGRASIYKEKGFTFDMGPSWYLMPDVFERYFKLFNKLPSDFYTLQRLNPAYRIFFNKNKVIDITDNIKQTAKLFETLEKGGGAKFKEYLAQSKYQYDTAMEGFIYKEYTSFMDLFDKKLMINGSKLKVFESIDSHVKRFFSSDIARKILEYNIVFLGGTPENTPALYSIMAHIDFNLGVWYPKGGIGTVVKALYDLSLSLGVHFEFNSEVIAFDIKDNGIKKVKTKSKLYAADIILANADYPFIETQLLEKKYQTYSSSYWKKKTIAPSAFIVYLGVKGKIKNLSHHNLFLEQDWMKHFDKIFKDPSWPEEFSYYVSCPTKTDPLVAPKGDENIFILVPVASGIEDTPEIRQLFYDKVMNHLEKTLNEDIRKRIKVKKIFTIHDFAEKYNAYQGTALGLTHTLFQSALFRPQMKSKKVSNLYYVGQYTHPGIGVPMSLISAEIVTEKIQKEYANR